MYYIYDPHVNDSKVIDFVSVFDNDTFANLTKWFMNVDIIVKNWEKLNTIYYEIGESMSTFLILNLIIKHLTK